MGIIASKGMRNFSRDIKSVYESNKTTLLIILLYAILEAARAAVPYEYYWDIRFAVHMIRKTFGYLIIPSLFIETYFAQSKGKCICSYIVAVIFSGLMAACGDLYVFTDAPAADEGMPMEVAALLREKAEWIVGPGGALLKRYAGWFLYAVLWILSIAIVYKCFKRTKLSFINYIYRVFCNVVKSFVIWRILSWGGALVDWIVESYFLREYYYEYTEWIAGKILVMGWRWMGPVEILVMGCYLGPKMILALGGAGEKV